MLNVGVVGLGNMGRLHMMNCLHIDDVRVVAAADSSKRALNKARSVGVKNLYTDYHSLLNDFHGNMDAVIISLPNFLHFESIELALEAGLIEPRDDEYMVTERGREFLKGFRDYIEHEKEIRGQVEDANNKKMKLEKCALAVYD